MKSLRVRPVRGFSLIEVLVGVGIGLIGIVVMFRMVALWDAHTRTSTSGSDAQVSGTLAMFNLERDIRQAGLGFGTAAAPFMGCSVAVNDTATARVFNFPLYPVQIVPGAGGGPDVISVLYGNSSFYVDEETFKFSTATTKTMQRRGGFRPGDLAVVAGNDTGAPASATCALVEVTDNSNPDNVTLGHTTGNYTSFYATAASATARFNPPGGTGGTFSSGRMYSLGPSPQYNVWQINAGGVLARSDLIHNTPVVSVAEHVVSIKAQYGIDTDADLRPDNWTTVAPVNWTTVLAIRTAILVRGKQFERSADPTSALPVGVTPNAPTWAGGTFLMTNVDGTPDSFNNNQDDPNNWRFYRYRVYERVIPLRNMIWGTAP
jgi:type IV pilus assembly protein PilW